MYSTCIFCNGRLGTNEVVETFPVGRRVAFDPERGRLWVVCPHCRQWNLAPLEERWETLEVLNRLFRDTPTRYSTEHIGLARLREGMDIVRIGAPSRPEYAAWRYGGELLRRRRRALVVGGLAVAGGAVVVGGAVGGLIVGGAVPLINTGFQFLNLYRNVWRDAARVELADGTRVALKRRHAQHVHVEPEEDGWRLVFPYRPIRTGWRLTAMRWASGTGSLRHGPEAQLRGEVAVRAAARILPALNAGGASRRNVADAARFVEENGTAEAALARVLRLGPSFGRIFLGPAKLPRHDLYRLPAAVRLGLEMATQEAAERRALEDELAMLEAEWREAEEIAAIADDLVLPGRIRRFLRRARHGHESD